MITASKSAVLTSTRGGNGVLSVMSSEGSGGAMMAGDGTLITVGADGSMLCMLQKTKAGDGMLTTYNARGQELVKLGSAESAGAIATYAGDGHPLVLLGGSKGGAMGTLITYNAEGKELVEVGAAKAKGVMDGTGTVIVRDPTGRTRPGTLATRPQ